MKKTKTNLVVTLVFLLVFLIIAAINQAGILEPNSPPGPTMKTLDDISAEISQNSPIKKVVRGVIEYTWDQSTVQNQSFSPPVDPNKSVVYLSEAMGYPVGGITESTISRNGACLISLTDSEITVEVEPHGQFNQKVSYQILEYK